jgi:hypothetical protein
MMAAGVALGAEKSFTLPSGEEAPAAPVKIRPLRRPGSTDNRQAVPDAKALADAEQRANSAFSDVLKEAETPSEKSQAAQSIYKAGVEETDPVLRYALLMLARNTAARAGDAEFGFQVAEMLADLYKVEPSKLQHEVAVVASANLENHPQRQAFVAASEDAVDLAIATSDFGTAINLARLAAAQAKTLRMEDSVWATRMRELLDAQNAFNTASGALELTGKPGADGTTYATAGAYTCFYQGNWEGGLALLAKGNDEFLKKLAARELAPTKDQKEILAIADAWWDFSEKQSGVAKKGIRRHAAGMYEQLLPVLTGLSKAQSEKRVEELSKPSAAALSGVTTLVVEALVDGHSHLHIRRDGIYWEQGKPAKPGRHQGKNAPTYVNGQEWYPKWAKPGAGGPDKSERYGLRMAGDRQYTVEVLSIGPERDTNRKDKRDEIQVSTKNGEGVIHFPDTQAGARWYKFKISTGR